MYTVTEYDNMSISIKVGHIYVEDTVFKMECMYILIHLQHKKSLKDFIGYSYKVKSIKPNVKGLKKIINF